MNKEWKTVAWLCIFSTLLMGCYTSVVIDPRGEGKSEMNSENVEYVIRTDGTKYVFDKPPQVTEEAVIGKVNGKEVSIPLSAIVEASIAYSMVVGWIVLGVGVAIIIGFGIHEGKGGQLPF